ncbi:uncharacterized protein G2W53_010271 [Senna tora]|uniref:Uncharacterized protein n=1 Tax=Senna tora TaxID=362788 RepID=A0A835CDV3_9FABA|nr:uncharacterized protein G2W53_010271 [Senna tora]
MDHKIPSVLRTFALIPNCNIHPKLPINIDFLRFNRDFGFKICVDMTSHSFHAITSSIRALNPLGFTNTTQSEGMTAHSLHAITSPIRALSPLRFRTTNRSDRLDSLVQRHV